MLPIFKSESQEFSMMQTSWAQALNKVIDAPMNKGILLKSVALASGATTVNHLLGRMLQGWQITDINGAATIYRSQPKSDLTLTLTSSAAVTVDIFVF